MENNENNIIMSRLAFERMQAKDERNDLWRNITIIVLIILMDTFRARQEDPEAQTNRWHMLRAFGVGVSDVGKTDEDYCIKSRG